MLFGNVWKASGKLNQRRNRPFIGNSYLVERL